MKNSVSRENYIKAIFHLQQGAEMVSTNALAAALQTRPASVTDMLKKLKEQHLLQYERYRGVRLTAGGRKIALQIIRKHRLWESFLVEKLHFGWEEVHEVAEELEHISSKKLIDRLDAFLDFPQTDPHGDPIPDAGGKIVSVRQVFLAEMPESAKGRVIGIGDQSPEMLDLLRHKNIGPGTRFEVCKKMVADGSVEIKMTNNRQLVSVSGQVANQLRVVYDNKN